MVINVIYYKHKNKTLTFIKKSLTNQDPIFLLLHLLYNELSAFEA